MSSKFTVGQLVIDRTVLVVVRVVAIDPVHARSHKPVAGFLWKNEAKAYGEKDHSGFCPEACEGGYEAWSPPKVPFKFRWPRMTWVRKFRSGLASWIAPKPVSVSDDEGDKIIQEIHRRYVEYGAQPWTRDWKEQEYFFRSHTVKIQKTIDGEFWVVDAETERKLFLGRKRVECVRWLEERNLELSYEDEDTGFS